MTTSTNYDWRHRSVSSSRSLKKIQVIVQVSTTVSRLIIIGLDSGVHDSVNKTVELWFDV